MADKKPHALPPSVIYCFFALGIISAIAFRAIIVFQRLEPSWVRKAAALIVDIYFMFAR